MPKQEVAFHPDPAALLSDPDCHLSVLLDGRSRHSWGDGTVIFADDPIDTLTLSASECELRPPVETLQDFLRQYREAGCGVFVALSYDLKHWIEDLPRRLVWPKSPILYAAAFDWRYVANRRHGGAVVSASTNKRLRWAVERFDRMGAENSGEFFLSEPVPQMSRDTYIAMIEKTKKYIRAGDIYQANMAQSFRFALDRADGANLFRQWTADFPTPYAAFVDGGEWALLSNSPECFLDIHGKTIGTFPIKGTRGIEPGQSVQELSAELASDPKELAEHVMIVDLERNDLGRICVTGSIHVPEMWKVCEFPMLIHMISEVCGEIREDVSFADILRATFPGGSITGAPKIRAMQIIEELEPCPRGFYTGSLGWIEPDGRTRFNIAIRTGYLDNDGLIFHAGGGIVADSIPQREYDETYAKSMSLFQVLTGPRTETTS